MKRGGGPPQDAAQAPPAQNTGPKLLNRRDIDVPDELETAWKTCWSELQNRIANATEADAVSFLQIRAGESQERHNEVVSGLLFSIFTLPQVAMLHWKWLSVCQRDDWDFCVDQLKRLAADKFHKLVEPCKKQLMWIIQELIRARAKNLDGVFSGLLRHVAGGEYSPKNTQLAASLLKMLQDNKAWLYTSPRLISTVFYTFTRLITDHSKQSALSTLRQQELSFMSTLFREKFEECRVIGRDLIRLVDEVKKFPEFEVIWKDILHKPTAFSPTLTSITDILSVRTPPKYLTSRLTPDMEAQLMFMLKNVKMGNQKRYQTWFMQKYMSAPDSETLVPDLIRYICCNYHPPNHVLCSDIVPRWAIIGWLLKCVKTKYVGNSAKMALFWDWFSFDPRTDNIMNIEPAILLMMHSIPKYSDITATLLDFLASTIDSYEEQRREFARRGVHNSFSVCLGKNVVPSLAPLYNCHALDPSIRVKLHPILRPFLKEDEAKLQQKPPSASSSPVISGVGSPTLGTSPTLPSSPTPSPQKSPIPVTTATLPKLPFPQLLETEPLMAGRKGSPLDNFDVMPLISPKRQASPTEELYSRPESGADEATEEQDHDSKAKSTRTDIPTSLLEVERTLGKLIDSLSPESDSRSFEVQSSNMHNLIAHFVKMSSGAKYSQEAATDLAQFFANALAKEFSELSLDTVFSSKPSLHHNLFSADPALPFALLDILHELRLLVPSLGFRFLVWLIVHGIKGIDRRRGEPHLHDETSLVERVEKCYKYMTEFNDDVLEPYVAFVEHSASKGSTESQEHPFLMDCKLCVEESIDVFMCMVPYLFRYLPEYSHTYRFDIVQLIVTNADPTHVGPLMYKLTTGEFEMFGTRVDEVTTVLDQSIGLDSISQFCLWQLLDAELNYSGEATEAVAIGALDVLRVQDHAQSQEFAQGLLGLLRTVAPSSPLLQAVFMLPLFATRLSSALLHQWSSKDINKLCPLLFSELQRVIAKGANVKEEDQERESMDTDRGHVDRKYAKRVAGHLDKWCSTLRADVKRRGPDTNNLAVLSGLLQRVIRIHGLPNEKYDSLSPSSNHGRADERYGSVDSRKRKRTSSGGQSTTPSPLSASVGGETAAEREKRHRAMTSRDELPQAFDHKKRRLTPFDAHSPDVGDREPPHENERSGTTDLKRRDGPNIPPQGRHAPSPQARPVATHVHMPPGVRPDPRLTSSTSGIPRRASNGALDETRLGREPQAPNRKRSLSGSSAQAPPIQAEGEGERTDDKDSDKGGDAGARKRKVKRISMDHEPEFDQ